MKPKERYPVINPDFDRDWFAARFEALDLKYPDIAKPMRRDRSTVSFVMSGKRRLTLAEAAIWAKLLGEDIAEVIRRAGVEDVPAAKGSTVPVKGWVDAELKVHWSAPRGPRNVQRPGHGPEKLGALRLETSGGAFDGALVFYPLNSLADPATLILKLCLVDQDRLRMIRRGYRSGRFNLADLAGKTVEEDAKIAAAAPILSILMGE